MEAGIVRGIGTLVLFVSFVLFCMWAWSPAQRRRFDEASRIPFLDDGPGEHDVNDVVSIGRAADPAVDTVRIIK
jgi:cytochrome c oxidase cbb3-type subunit IV